MALDPALGELDYCYLTTTGRRSGLPREIEIWFGLRGSTLYMLSGGGDRSDWVRNLRADPSVSVRLGDRTLRGRARIVDDVAEEAVARPLVHGKYASGPDDMAGWRDRGLVVAIDLEGVGFGAMALPDDPAAFVAAAERGINEYDLEATASAYAADGRLENYVDGSFEEWEGGDAIRAAWGAYLDAMRERRFTLRKTLLSAADDTIVNTWTGSLGGRTDAEGIEYWRFDADGKVREHRMYSLMNVKSSTHPLARLRMAAAYPVSALAFLRSRKRAGI